jgi:GDSL-like Lipase/Acylhydrolase family
MIKRLPLLLALLMPAVPVSADQPADGPAACRVAQHQIENNFKLPQVTRAIAGKRLDILVLGAGSSSLAGAEGVKNSYPARLQAVLEEMLPGVTVKVTTDVKARRTAAEMVQGLSADLVAAKPALVIWQTGTVDAMQSVDPDQFNRALDMGISATRAAGADIVLVNSQYSPRTDSMIALGTYADNMRWVAVQHEIPLFDRFSIMKLWADLGTFDFYAATKKFDMAEKVHDCIGRLLADLVVGATKPEEPPAVGGQ